MALPASQGGASSESSTLVGDGAYDPVPAEEFEHDETRVVTPEDDTPHRTLKSNRSSIPLMPSPSTRVLSYGDDTDGGAEVNTPLDVDTPHPHAHLPLHHLTAPPTLPPALHSNFLTSCIGVATFFMGLPLIYVLHWLNWETFRWPASDQASTMTMWSGIAMVAATGASYVSACIVRADGRMPVS